MPSGWIRFRPPTGLLRVDQTQVIARVAARLALVGAGDFQLEIDRGAISLLENAGLDIHTAGGRPRVLCSPLTGRSGGHLDARPLAHSLEQALSAGHAATPADSRGRGEHGLIGIDDGTGDISGLGLPVVFAALGASEFAVRIDGADSGARLHIEADQTDWLEAATRHENGWVALEPKAADIPIGWLAHSRDGLVTLGAAVPGGILDGRQLQFLAALERPVVLTPWRTILLCDLDEWAAEQVVRVLAPLGFVFDADSHVVAELAGQAEAPDANLRD